MEQLLSSFDHSLFDERLIRVQKLERLTVFFRFCEPPAVLEGPLSFHL